MTRSRAVLPALALLVAGVLTCRAEPTITQSSTPRVVVKSSNEPSKRDLSGGVAVGPSAEAPEIVVLNDAPQETATRRTVRKPEPGPQVVYRTVYIKEQPSVSEESEDPAPESVPETIVEPSVTPVVPEPQPVDIPDPVATAPPTPETTTVPTGGSSRTEDAIVGAAIGAGVGAILGGRRGALAGGLGGAIGGATGGRTGGILGGVLGGSSGGGACIPEPRCHPRRGRCY
jgi:hypothetical protein